MVEKYMERNKKISISQVDILEFFNFYKEIAKYQYLYTLENNLKIKLAFNIVFNRKMKNPLASGIACNAT